MMRDKTLQVIDKYDATNDNNVVYCFQLLLYVRKLAVTLAINKCMSSEEAHDETMCNQLCHMLDDALAKFNNKR